jgi:hypothetical protein
MSYYVKLYFVNWVWFNYYYFSYELYCTQNSIVWTILSLSRFSRNTEGVENGFA